MDLTLEEVIEHRAFHISRVRELFKRLDLFIFTLGSTEMWIHKDSGTVYPTAPGTLLGNFDQSVYEFKNAQFQEIISDFNLFQKVLLKIRGGNEFNCLLTVSPVPLTATASEKHILSANAYSKSILRSVAGQLSTNQPHIDYFPSYEIVTNPRMHSTTFADNLRSVRGEAVDTVMRHFFAEHQVLNSNISNNNSNQMAAKSSEYPQCEEELIEAFEE